MQILKRRTLNLLTDCCQHQSTIGLLLKTKKIFKLQKPRACRKVPQWCHTMARLLITALASYVWYRFGRESPGACSRLGWYHQATLVHLCRLTPCSWGKCPPRQTGCGMGRGSRQADLRYRQFRRLGCGKNWKVNVNGQNKVGLII